MEQKDNPTTLLQGHTGFDKCKLRASGSGCDVSVPGPHSRIQQYRLGGSVPESPEGAETVDNGGESGIKDRGNSADVGYDA